MGEPEGSKPIGERFSIAGSWNAWNLEPMILSEEITGLYTTEVQLDSEGVGTFNIVADEDSNMTYYPALPSCTRKAAEIIGPAAIGQDSEDAFWFIQGPPD